MDEDLVKKLKEFRFRKETNNAAIVSEYLCHSVSFSHMLLIVFCRSDRDGDVRSPGCK